MDEKTIFGFCDGLSNDIVGTIFFFFLAETVDILGCFSIQSLSYKQTPWGIFIYMKLLCFHHVLICAVSYNLNYVANLVNLLNLLEIPWKENSHRQQIFCMPWVNLTSVLEVKIMDALADLGSETLSNLFLGYIYSFAACSPAHHPLFDSSLNRILSLCI